MVEDIIDLILEYMPQILARYDPVQKRVQLRIPVTYTLKDVYIYSSVSRPNVFCENNKSLIRVEVMSASHGNYRSCPGCKIRLEYNDNTTDYKQHKQNCHVVLTILTQSLLTVSNKLVNFQCEKCQKAQSHDEYCFHRKYDSNNMCSRILNGDEQSRGVVVYANDKVTLLTHDSTGKRKHQASLQQEFAITVEFCAYSEDLYVFKPLGVHKCYV